MFQFSCRFAFFIYFSSFIRCVRADLDLIMDAERFARIDGTCDYERNQYLSVVINYFIRVTPTKATASPRTTIQRVQ